MPTLRLLPCEDKAGALLVLRRPPQRRETHPSTAIGLTSNIIPFRPRGTPRRRQARQATQLGMYPWPAEDLGKYEKASEIGDDDYGHRLLVNSLAAIMLVFLVVSGSWMLGVIKKSGEPRPLPVRSELQQISSSWWVPS